MEMNFEYPGLLWLLVIPVLLVLHYILLEFAQRHPHLRVSTAVPWKAAGTSFMTYLRHVPFVFRIAAVALLIIALARPRLRHDGIVTESEGIDIVMAMDVSTSMLSCDLRPDRLEASKSIAANFIADRRSDRIGIVLFAGESFTQCPLTTDKNTLISMMGEITTGYIDDGTAIGNGLATAVSRLVDSDAPSRVVILLTDGVNNSGDVTPEMAMEIANQYGIRVYTIGVGKEGVAKYPVNSLWGVTYQDVLVEIDEELLKEIARSTGGQYYRATDNTTLAEIYAEINQLEKGRTTVDNVVSYDERFSVYLLWAFAALMIELMLNWFVIRRLS